MPTKFQFRRPAVLCCASIVKLSLSAAEAEATEVSKTHVGVHLSAKLGFSNAIQIC